MRVIAIVLSAAVLTGACAKSESQRGRIMVGATTGAATGAVIGGIVSSKSGSPVPGAVAGAVGGGVIGALTAHQKCIVKDGAGNPYKVPCP